MLRVGDTLTVSQVSKSVGWVLLHDDLGNSYEADIDPSQIDTTTEEEDE